MRWWFRVLKLVCFYLAILNVVDGTITYIGLKLNIIDEGNIVMSLLDEYNSAYFLLLKFSLSAFLVWILCYTNINPSNILGFFSLVGATLYTIVMFMHLYWIFISFLI
ncbi:DUF5658 family protein [Metabacillus halosaccharovorans]|uniref:DUF5658 family protein n=1 Tax=Metabacillus halosaccharovorans TaxID=930124 RepID=UPI00384E7FDE